MDIIVHDLQDFDEKIIFKNGQSNATVIADKGKIHPCTCCFGCWIKTPGQCVINDGYDNMGLLLSKSSHLIIISQCCYGSYSPFVHNVLDRSISYLLPYFRTYKGETHHRNRYDNHLRLSVHFYGKILPKEKETAQKLVQANEVNFFTNKAEIYFYDEVNQIKGIL